MKRVAIQGGLGAYHGIAAENFFKNEEVEIIPCITFRDIFAAIKKRPERRWHYGYRKYDCWKFTAKLRTAERI